MADKNKKDSKVLTDFPNVNSSDDPQNADNIDDFDPFSGVVEYSNEYIDVDLNAPPEKE